MAATKEKVGKVRAKQAMVVTVGARPPEWQKRIVRDRHSGKLVEIDMNPELPPIDEGDLGAATSSPRARKWPAITRRSLDAPGAFEPVDD